jgi:hypothetical protein
MAGRQEDRNAGGQECRLVDRQTEQTSTERQADRQTDRRQNICVVQKDSGTKFEQLKKSATGTPVKTKRSI